MSVDEFVAWGHGISTDGSHDVGCTWNGYTEENLVGPIAKSMVACLRQNGLTISSDVDTGNDRNCTYTIRDANACGAGLYTSIHCDWDQAPSGTYPIVYPDSTQGIRLAQCLDNAVRALAPSWSHGSK